jgi:hypothetical protein
MVFDHQTVIGIMKDHRDREPMFKNTSSISFPHFSAFGQHRSNDEGPCHEPFMTERESSRRAITHFAGQLVDVHTLRLECLDRDQPARVAAGTTTGAGSLIGG